MVYENRGFVTRQYAGASKVGARISPHRRFSTNSYPWQRWVFEPAARGGIRITEVVGMFVARK